jgi:hypothetical protein
VDFSPGFHGAVTFTVEYNVLVTYHRALLVYALSVFIFNLAMDNKKNLPRRLALRVDIVILVEPHRLQLIEYCYIELHVTVLQEWHNRDQVLVQKMLQLKR